MLLSGLTTLTLEEKILALASRKRPRLPTMLFVPGSDDRKLAKSATLDVPAFILDLEDSVAEERKSAARELVSARLDEIPLRSAKERIFYVRINGMRTAHALDDLLAVVRPGLTGLLIPKVEGPQDLHVLDWVLDQLEASRGLKCGSIEYIALIETARALLHIGDIAKASPRLRCFALGSADLSADLGISLGPPEAPSPVAVSLKTALVVASRAAGLDPPHEGAYLDHQDQAGLRDSTESARSMGFSGRHAIHPDQVPVILAVFQPRESEVAWAEKVIASFDESLRQGVASTTVDGQFVDYAIAERARRILEAAEAMQ